MADAEADAALQPEMQRLAAGLRSRLWQLQAELSERGVAAASSGAYCREFCQTLLQYAGNRGASEHVLPFLEVYRVAIQSFANARPYLTTECEDVLLVLGRLVLSCFELLLSVPESEEQSEPLSKLFQSIQDSHNALLEFGDSSLEILADICKEGVWKNPVLVKIISQQPVEAEEVNKLIKREGPTFLQMRIKRLMKTDCLPQAASLSKLCKESTEIPDASPFLQAYITCLCSMHPNEESFKEIAKVDCKEVLDMICNLEAEGQESTAFILCTTYLTQQLQTANVYCSWELTLFWSKLQRRIDPSLDSFLERSRQFGIIARTLQHLLFLIRVIQAEAEEAGLAVSVLLCVRALQLRSNENDNMKTSVCRTIACLLPEDLEVRRACQLTEYLLEPTEEGYNLLEELYLLPDQKFDEENAPVPNSLRCELLLALKAYWPFDPEFWDWKTLRRHCLKLLGKEVSESEDDLSCNEMSFNETELLDSLLSDCEEGREENNFEGVNQPKERVRIKKPIGSSERYQRWLQYKFFCVICKRECIEARILHHSKMHMEDGVFTCPVCIKKFKRKDVFVSHVMEHVKMPPSRKYRAKKKMLIKKEKLTKSSLSRLASPGLEENQPFRIIPCEKPKIDPQDYVTFSKLENCHLQDRDLYPCPGTDCSRVFKQFKYLSVHLKAEHQNNDENAMHYLNMKNRREKCSYCRRHFMSAVHLQEHEQVHSGPQPYMCVSVGCYARFSSVNELLHHKQQHDDLRYKCELSGCNIVFSDLGQLYHHEAQHFRDASYTCNFHGCKKFYYSKSEFTNHLSMHISNGEMKEVPIKPEDNVSRDSLAGLSDSAVVEQKDPPRLHESLSLPSGSTNSEGILEVKQEPLSDGEVDGKNNGSVGSNIASSANENEITLLTETVDCGQAAPSALLPHEKVFHPSNLKERYSNVAVYFDGKRFTCGFEGCGSTYKNSKGMQKHLRRAHPYHFKPKRKYSLKAKDVSLHDSSAGEISSELHHHSDTNVDSPGIINCNTSSNSRSYLKEEPCPSSPEISLFEHSKAPSTEDAMLELLLGLKHLSLKNSSGQLGSSSKLLQSYSSKCPNSEDESTSDHFLEEQRGKLPNQYLTQLAAKPFFCERQGCTCEFVTREALLTHYVRKHNYSKEMVLQLNMFQHRYSPFKCHICQRSFTRKTHLRVHYRNKHKLGNVTATQKLFANESFEDGDCTEDMLNSSVASMSSFYANTEEELDDQDKLTGGQLCHPKKEELSSESDLESSEEAESCVSGKQAKLSALDSHRKGLEAREGRGSKRTVAKGNLCYILHKYHKPFHCIHKNCNSAFTNQKGLIRHYRTVHQYNKEQLCLEKDKARTKRELAKCKKIFVCKDKACSKRFLCPKSLAKHCSDFHALDHEEDSKVLSESESVRFPCHHPHCPAAFYSFHKLKHHLMEEHAKEEEVNKEIEIHCDLNGCNRVFTTYSRYSQHVYFRHSDYDGVMGSAKEKGNHLQDEQEERCLKNRCLRHDVSEKRRQINEKNNNKNKGKQLYNFRTREEALKMCRDNYNQTQYPCMIQGCPSVVKLESSIVRHYKRTHQMASVYIEQQYEELVLCVECGTVINDACLEESQGSNKDANCNFKQDTTLHSAYQHGREECLDLNSSFDHEDEGSKNSRCSGSDKTPETGVFLCTGTLKHIHSPKTRGVEERSLMESAQQCKTDVEEFPGRRQERETDGRENNSSCTRSDTQLPREKDAGGWQHTSLQPNTKKLPFSAPKDKLQKQLAPKPFDIKSFKPMGFESSFLKFIQESEARGDDDDDDDDDSVHEWEPTEQPERGGMAEKDKDIKRDLSQSRAKCENVPATAAVSKKNSGSKAQGQLRGVQPLLSTDSPIPSLENLRAILDRALTNCGDHALKQLHYLRPVVVLERSKFSTSLIDFFPTKKTDHLCVGSS